jgi:hypothetical protein
MKYNVDGEALVKAIAVRLETESGFLSPQPVTYVTDPCGVLKLVEEAGASPEQIDRWINEALIKEADWLPAVPEPTYDFSEQIEEALSD